MVATNPPADLDDWTKANLDRLDAMARRGIGALAGDRIVHRDIRSDNVLIRPDGRVVLVDWPWAALGPAWFDTALLLVEVCTTGGHDVPALLAETAHRHQVPEADIYGVLAAVAGYCRYSTALPAPPSIPNVRAFQRTQADALVALLAGQAER
jgi:aminoglycoside phosphotransferase (APT) family kinase protein